MEAKVDSVATRFLPLHLRDWKRLKPDGLLPLPPKCQHAQVPTDNSTCSPGGSLVIHGETEGSGALYLRIQVKQILKSACLPTLFPYSVHMLFLKFK